MQKCQTCVAIGDPRPKAGTHGDVAYPHARFCVDHKTPSMDLLIQSPRPAPQKPREDDGA